MIKKTPKVVCFFNVSKGLKGMMSYINIMESISEHLPTNKCSSCRVSRELTEIGPNGRNGCFKTCQKCREHKKRTREKKANSIQSQRSNPVLTIDDFVRDGWAGMTAELLEPMSYEERCAIRINLNTVVSRLNIFFICENIIRYCVRDPSLRIEETGSVPVGTIMDTETIEVHLPDRGAHFTVKLGDTWRDIRENIHCC